MIMNPVSLFVVETSDPQIIMGLTKQRLQMQLTMTMMDITLTWIAMIPMLKLIQEPLK